MDWGMLSCSVVREWLPESDQLFANVILWTLGRNYMSINALMIEFQFGWNKASRMVKRMEELGIVDKLEGKAPRNVIPGSYEDLPEELQKFLEDNGCSGCAVIYAIVNRE